MRIAFPITLLLMLAAGLLAGGFWQAREQVVKLSRYRPTQARVIETGITSSRLGGYRPKVVYEYSLQGQTVTADRFSPLPTNGTRIWAEAMAATYDVGARVNIYTNPTSNPGSGATSSGSSGGSGGDAYLHRNARFYPYALMLLGVLLIGLCGVLTRVSGVTQTRPHAAKTDPRKWYRLTPAVTPQSAAASSMLGAIGHLAATTLISAHYFFMLNEGVERLAWLALPAVAIGFIPALRAWRKTKADAPFCIPVLETALPEARLDLPLVTRLELQVRQDVEVDEVRVALVCLRRHGLTNLRLFSEGETAVAHRRFARGEWIIADLNFEVPHKKRRATSEGTRWSFPRIDWQLEVTTRHADGGAAVTTFPIQVRFPTEEEIAQAKRKHLAA